MGARRQLAFIAAALAAALAAAVRSGGADASSLTQQPVSVALVAALNAVTGGSHQGFRANHGAAFPTIAGASISRMPLAMRVHMAWLYAFS
jgi:hypothetical protein